jgi:hypothetical protein
MENARPDLTLIESMPHSYENGSVFLPDYDAEVAAPSKLKGNPIDCEHGKLERRTIELDDGTRYHFNKFIPRIQRSNTAIGEITAWWTHPDLEHYRKAGRSAIWLGYPYLVIGPPSGVKAPDVSLSKAIYDAHRIYDAELPSMNVDPNTVIQKGSSRGAMTGMGMSVPKYARERNFPYIDVNAACIAEKFEAEEWPLAIAQAIGEGVAIAKVGWEYAKRRQLHTYMQRLLPEDLSHVPNAFRIFPGLINGEAGRLYDESDPNTAIHLVEYAGDYWGQAHKWEDKFEGRNNAKMVRKPGMHIDGIARTDTRRDINARLHALSELRGYDGAFEKINFAEEILSVDRFTHKSISTALSKIQADAA